MIEQTAELRQWELTRSPTGNMILRGRIYNDATKRFEDGEMIRTSALKYLDVEEGIAKTLNTTYILD
jgi:hypothetical protein